MLFFLYTTQVNKRKFYQKYGFCQEGPSYYPVHWLMASQDSLNIFGESSS